MNRKEAIESVLKIVTLSLDLENQIKDPADRRYVKGLTRGMAMAYQKAEIITLDDYRTLIKEVNKMLNNKKSN